MRAIIAACWICCTPVMAQECQDGSNEILTVENWQVEKVEGILSGIDITVELRSHASKPFRMIDASFTFHDTLDRRISSFTIDPDLKAKPGETVSTVNGYMGREMDRVPSMDRADVVVFACTRAVVYEDGSKEFFEVE